MAKRSAFLAVALAAVAASASAPARGQDDPACAKYQEPLAYNACLASHGPKATDVATNPAQAHQVRAAQMEIRRARPAQDPRVRRNWMSATRHRGRAHMEFRVR
jgi:hypothetical protein